MGLRLAQEIKLFFLFVDGDVVCSLLEDMFKVEVSHGNKLRGDVGSSLNHLSV